MTPMGDASPELETSSNGMLERLRIATKGDTYAQIARVTGCNSETVRRYLNGGTPSVHFICAVAEQYRVSADWLLLGRGPRPPAASDRVIGGGGTNPPGHAPAASPPQVTSRLELRQPTDGATRMG